MPRSLLARARRHRPNPLGDGALVTYRHRVAPRQHLPKLAISHAIVYLRVSTEEQARSGLGKEAQEAACRGFCTRLGWEVASIHVDDGMSGKLPVSERPGISAAFAELRPGRAFVVYSLSRAFRSQRECWMCVEDEHGNPSLPLVSATENFDLTTAFGRAAFGMIATFARLEADLVSERTTAALAAAKERGVRLGSPRMTERMLDGKRVLDPDAVARIRRIAEIYREVGSMERTAEELNRLGVPTSRKGRWHKRSVGVALGYAAALALARVV